jgi:hypothetical protein
MRKEQDNVLSAGGERASWHEIVDAGEKGVRQRTPCRWGGSVMVLDCGRGCKESRKTYFLEVERKRVGVRLWTRMGREQDNILSGSGEGE